MFGIFKTKSKVDKLQKRYNKLMSECHKVSKINRSESDKIYAEAQEVLNEIESLIA